MTAPLVLAAVGLSDQTDVHVGLFDDPAKARRAALRWAAWWNDRLDGPIPKQKNWAQRIRFYEFPLINEASAPEAFAEEEVHHHEQ